jgi:hypothetical protein
LTNPAAIVPIAYRQRQKNKNAGKKPAFRHSPSSDASTSVVRGKANIAAMMGKEG